MKSQTGTSTLGDPMGFANGKGKGPMRKICGRAAVLCAAIAGTAAGAFGQVVPQQTSPTSGFFAWDVPAQTYANYTESPFLSDDASAAQVSALFETFRTGAPSGANPFGTFSKPLAVKINNAQLSTNAKKVFDNYPVSYVFADYEGPPGTANDPVAAPLQISNLVSNSAASKQAFVGNFNIYPNAGSDPTRPASTGTGAASFTYHAFDSSYQQMRGTNFTTGARGRLMSNEALYPGAPDYKTPNAPAVATPGTDTTKLNTYQSIRIGLFTQPIERLTTATNGLGTSSTDAHIPWVDRFNNFGNNALNNAVDPTGKFQYQFVSNATDSKKGGLLSRGDFMALVLNYRMRGADSFILFNDPYGSVLNYSDAQEHLDAAHGWGASGQANQVFSKGKANYAFANLSNLVTTVNSKNLANYPNGQPHHAINGTFATQTSDTVGVVWSGVYSKSAFNFTGTGTQRVLTIALSNLSNTDKLVDMPNSIGGFRTETSKGTNGVGGVYSGDNGDDDYWIGAGQHRIMNFTLIGGKWVLKSNSFVFGGSDSAGSLEDRNGTGVPEPTSAGVLAVAAFGLLARRRRQTASV